VQGLLNLPFHELGEFLLGSDGHVVELALNHRILLSDNPFLPRAFWVSIVQPTCGFSRGSQSFKHSWNYGDWFYALKETGLLANAFASQGCLACQNFSRWFVKKESWQLPFHNAARLQLELTHVYTVYQKEEAVTWSVAGVDAELWPLPAPAPPDVALEAESSLATCLCVVPFCAAVGVIVGSAGLAELGELLKVNNFFMLENRAQRIAT
jgi:hypothetical protein